jgi:hypothetical protein
VEHIVTSNSGATVFKSESNEAFLGKAANVDQLDLRNPNPAFIDEAKLILDRQRLKG